MRTGLTAVWRMAAIVAAFPDVTPGKAMHDTRFKLRVPRELLARMQAAASGLGPDATLSGIVCRCLRRWRRAGMPASPGVAANKKRELATRDGSVPLSLEIPAELTFRLTPAEIRAAILFALDAADRCRRPARPIEIDPNDAIVPYEIKEELE